MLEGYRIEHLGKILTIILVLTIILAFEATLASKSSVSALVLGWSLVEYDISDNSGHGAVVFRVGNRRRVAQAFA